MNVHMWLIFFIAYLGITISPGPNVLVVLSHASKYGYSSIATTISANLTCQLIIIAAVGLGVGALVTTGSPVYYVIKYAGAAYLIYLGLKGLKGIVYHREKDKKTIGATPESIRLRAPMYKRYAEAFAVSASNPKTVIFLSAFLPQFVTPEHSVVIQFGIMFLTIAFIVTCMHSFYAYMFIRAKHKMGARMNNTIIPGISSAIYLLLGIGMGSSR